MSAVTDHDRRDAEHAARCEISIQISRYIRRLNAEAYAHIKQEIARAEHEQRGIDGTTLGREAAKIAAQAYLGEPIHDVIESKPTEAASLPPGGTS